MAANKLTVALVQQDFLQDRESNNARTASHIADAAAGGAQLVLLPELHGLPYFCQTEDTQLFDLAESIPGPTSASLSALAKSLQVVIVASLFERRASGLYHNTAVVLDSDGRLAGTYRKMHIPDDPGFYEKFYFTPGDLGFQPIETSVGKLGVLVCWDQWFPEAARLMTLAGAELLLYPTAIGWDPNDDEAEKTQGEDDQGTSEELEERLHDRVHESQHHRHHRIGEPRLAVDLDARNDPGCRDQCENRDEPTDEQRHGSLLRRASSPVYPHRALFGSLPLRACILPPCEPS